MTTAEFTLWLDGYLEALETEGVENIKIKNIKQKMSEINISPNQERVVFGPNVKKPQQQGYLNPDSGRSV